MKFRKALVVGLGASGRAACALLRAVGTSVVAYDKRAGLAIEGVQLHLGADEPPAEAFADIDLMVLSPGVPPARARALCTTHAPNAAIHGELGLALTLLPQPRPRTILITGTNGKSTVTALLGAVLHAAGRSAFVGGNLGAPPADMTRELLAGSRSMPEFLVLECSSYQLETLPRVDTEVAMLLNVTPDHLDRYDSLADYAHTKARVFGGLVPSGLALLDAADAWTDRLAPAGATLVDLEQPPAWSAATLPSLRLPGRHNVKNALFALVAARHLGIDDQACRDGLAGFEGLPHRMAFVRELDGVRWYNDSKATNVASALASVGGLSQPFVLIAGGVAKGDPLDPLGDVLRARGRGLVAIGESAPSFLALAHDAVPSEHAANMPAAVEAARRLAQHGDAVVLAPACASFDQFRNFAERGDAFAAAVLALG